jgi:8-oxo-dGTP pyrophosphatase MutT (NUDIX family)
MVVPEAGAVTFRKNENQIEFLIVRSKKDPSKWIFPKGHIEPGETAEFAATRELQEEAGVAGKSICFLGVIEYVYDGKILNVQYFLHEFLGPGGLGEPGRDPVWHSFEDTCKVLSFKDCIKLVEKAMEIIL